jgi:hypothetical protein
MLSVIADGKLYLVDSEHSPSQPLGRSILTLPCAFTGKEIWRIDHWGNGPILADGILVDLNTYDNQYTPTAKVNSHRCLSS